MQSKAESQAVFM